MRAEAARRRISFPSKLTLMTDQAVVQHPEDENGGDLPTRAYERLKSLIVHGRMAPGSRIIESDLANRLSVSRTPVRVALQRLRQEGLVAALGGGRNTRLIVTPLTREDGWELLLVLGAIEGLAARQIAAAEPAVRAEVAAAMREANEAMAELAQRADADPDELFELHSRLHNQYMEPLQAPRILASHASILPQAERYRHAYVAHGGEFFRAEVTEHDAIIDRIEKGDPEGAQLAVQANWEAAAERLSRMIDRAGSRGSW